MSIRGDFPQDGGRGGGLQGPQCGNGPVARTAELSPLEEAVAAVLPRWPEAYEAVIAYARRLSGYVPPPATTNHGREGGDAG